jgi:hemerythrin
MPPTIDPVSLPELPVQFMNEDHAREAALVNDVEDALAVHARGEGPVATVLERLSLLAVHTREHFLREESMMRETQFPAYPIHKAEHDRVLAGMDAEARAFRETGDAGRLGRYLRETLPEWFVSHIRTMDVVTARFVAAASTFAAGGATVR